ncbi:MAG: GGDEF domain-containing protein [Eubacterium sp.]|nr:GGDEF domain-containing protein [Eubacterium sp.]
MKEKKTRSLTLWFTVLFVSFAIVILVVCGFATYLSQTNNYKLDCEERIRNIGEYLVSLMKDDGEDFILYQDWYMSHYKELDIDYRFTSFEDARREFIKQFSVAYPGKAMGLDVMITEMSPELQNAYFTYKHEYWLLAFENARKAFDIPYTYYLVVGDPRGRMDADGVKDHPDKENTVVYMIDGERTIDEEKSKEKNDGKKYLYMGDTYYHDREDYSLLYNTWETGKRQNGYKEWDNDWGHTYGYYTPLIVNGKKLGLVVTEVDVATVNRDILGNTFREIGIIGGIFIVGLVLMLIAIRIHVIRRTTKLEKAMIKYSETKDAAIAEEVEGVFGGHDEIDSLGRQFVSMVREVADHLQRMIRANRQLEVSRKREHEMSELAIRDSLTGIRNKTAYDREVFKINRDIKDGQKKFGIAMVDLNFLKKINDNFGHEKGDEAIRKMCRLVCVTFAHSPVFRIGGDEFVVILRNDDYAAIDSLIEKFNEGMKDISGDVSAEMWETPTAAIGYALYDEKIDHGSYDSVFERADEAMYARKQEMKAIRKDDD